jgi:hypothetical protein
LNAEEIIKEKTAIIGQLQKYVPTFAAFLDFGKPVREYSNHLYEFSIPEIHGKRQKLIQEIILSKTKSLFGVQAANELNLQFGERLAYNIVDHHQVLNHPLLISSNVLANVEKIGQADKPPAIIVISSGDVPPNNYFSKNGFQFHGKVAPLFSVNERESTSYLLPKRDFNFIERQKIAKRWQAYNGVEHEFLLAQQEKVNACDFLAAQNYCDQISILVKETWPLLFEEKLRVTLPELIYITQEELTAACLIPLLAENNFISACLLDGGFRARVLENFRGIVVAWREKEHKGTHFFWRKHPSLPRSLRMYAHDGILVPDDERYRHLAIPLKKEVLSDALQTGEIYPSLFLIFSILNFYAGIKPLTGYGSTVYLEYFKQAWAESLKNSDFEEEMPWVDSVTTSGFVGGMPIFFKRVEGQLKALYAYDLIYEGGVTEEYLKKIFDMPFNQLVSAGLPGMYDYFSQKYIPETERISLKINTDDMAALAFAKLPNCDKGSR